jgi:hypothetical protein
MLPDTVNTTRFLFIIIHLPLPILKIQLAQDTKRAARLNFQVAFVHDFRCFVHGFPPQRCMFEHVIEYGVS